MGGLASAFLIGGWAGKFKELIGGWGVPIRRECPNREQLYQRRKVGNRTSAPNSVGRRGRRHRPLLAVFASAFVSAFASAFGLDFCL